MKKREYAILITDKSIIKKYEIGISLDKIQGCKGCKVSTSREPHFSRLNLNLTQIGGYKPTDTRSYGSHDVIGAVALVIVTL